MAEDQNEKLTKVSPSLDSKNLDSETVQTPSCDFDVVAGEYKEPLVLASDRKIGRYRLTNPIGEGGMGIVWRAAQEHPVKRDVALKFVRRDLGKDALARFEAERQAIAMMEHPNIARILDADTTDEGAPFFVMELVKGVPLDQYCNLHKLGIAERLRLMVPVCRAIQHAHQKAILHRDLKHSNILVAEGDEDAVPKVIDFGLAKALDSHKTLTDKTIHTDFGKVVGTIDYMSPEQAGSGRVDVDTRSDIFSLGVVLYKLLTGRTPLQMEGEGVSFIGALEAVREKDAIAPSLTVRNFDDCAQWVANNTSTNPNRFADQLKGDLDCIVLKALEKDRGSRYATASGMALDIERYLRNEPVLAQPHSTVYSINKFVRRNKGFVASLAAIISLLVIGIVATTSALMLARSETGRANASASVAIQEASRAKSAEARAKEAERQTATQLLAQRYKSIWNDWKSNNVQSAWQTLKQIEPASRGWISRYFANEMYTCQPDDSLHGHSHYVQTIDASGGGDFFISGGGDEVVMVWDAKTHQVIHRIVFQELVETVRFSRDQQQFAVADRSNLVSVFDTRSGKLLKKFGPYEEDVSSVSFHPKHPVLAMGFLGNDSTYGISYGKRSLKFVENRPADLWLVDIESGETLQTIQGHADEVTSLEFDATGDLLASGCMDGKIRIWKLAESANSDSKQEIKYELCNQISAHPMGVRKIDLTADGLTVVSCGNDKIASVWNASSGQLIAQLARHSDQVTAIDLSPNGKLVATSSNDQTAIVWDLQGNVRTIWQGHTAPISEVRFTADGDQIITASDDQTVRRWSTEVAGTSVTYRGGGPFEIWQADFSSDKSKVAVACENGEVRLIDTSTGELTKRLVHDAAVLCLEWLEDGRLITGGDGFGVWVWDRFDQPNQSDKPTRKVELGDSMIWDVSASPDEKRLVVASGDGTARILDGQTFQEIGVLRGHEDGLASARFSPDGTRIVTASDDFSVRVWDANTFEHLKTLQGHTQSVWRAIFSPTDHNLIASSASDGRILLWDLENEEPQPISIGTHTTHVAGLTFTSDGRNLISASDDGTVRIWDVATGVDLFVFQSQPAAQMIHASFSKDGLSLVTTGIDLVTVRHACPDFVVPYLSLDAEADTNRAEALADHDDEESIKLYHKVCRFYPTLASFTGLGTSLVHAGRYDEAQEALEEALRLHKIVNGTTDYRPWVEGYLVIAYAKAGKGSKARAMKEVFDRKAENWDGDPRTQQLQEEIRAVIGD